MNEIVSCSVGSIVRSPCSKEGGAGKKKKKEKNKFAAPENTFRVLPDLESRDQLE